MPRTSLAPMFGRSLAAVALVAFACLVDHAVPLAAHAGPAGFMHPLAPGAAGHAIWDPDQHRFWVMDAAAAGVWSFAPSSSPGWQWHGTGEFRMNGAPYWGGSAVFLDRARHRLVLYAGGQLHTLSTGPHAIWQSTPTSGPAPPTVSAVLDEAGDRLIFAGAGGALWQLTLSHPPTWSNLGVAATLPNFGISTMLTLDPAQRILVAAGGSYYDPVCPADVPSNKAWKLPLATMTWSALPDLPMADMFGARLLWDSARQRVLATGGQDAYDCGSPQQSSSSAVYALDPSSASPAWALLTSMPDNRAMAATGIDPDADALVAFGGVTPGVGFFLAESHRDVQVMPLSGGGAGTWSQLSGDAPRAATSSDMALDPTRGQPIVHGGLLASSSYGDIASTGSVMRFDDAGVVWSMLASAHDATSAASVVDAAHDRLILFGGCYQSPIPVSPCDFVTTTTAVSLGDGSVSEPVTGTSPPPRVSAVMVWDAALGGVVLFGGQDESANPLYDTWTLDTDTDAWSPVATSGLAPADAALSAAYDPASARVLVLSRALAGIHVHGLTAGTWHWTELTMTDSVPALQSIAVDTHRSRLLGLDGYVGIHEASLTAAPLVWHRLHAPQPIQLSASAFYDSSHDRLLIGLRPGSFGNSNTAMLAVDFGDGALGVPPTPAPVPATLRIAGAQPAPHGPDVEFELPAGGAPARLELYDLQGRRLWSREVGSLGAGTHRVRAGGEAWLPAGVYAVRLVRATSPAAVARAVVIP